MVIQLPDRRPLDALDTEQAVTAVLAGQAQVAQVVQAASGELGRAVDLLVARYQAGGRVLLLGAGTSGRLAVQEAVEVPGTYGIPADRIQARVAGGGPGQLVGTDAAEDDGELGVADVAELAAGPADVLIAVAASGRTPYTCAAAGRARELGAGLITVTNRPGSPLAALADIAIELPVGEEVVTGSTRLAAGTAQKLALNTLTTAMMIRLGRVHGSHMIDVVAANDKLRNRVAAAVADGAAVDTDRAWQALVSCDWNARAALVHLSTGLAPGEAARLAAAHRTVREAIEAAG
ncbi:MAG TPA: N-acetylmuramic acid 6-phosphate etherase [Jatrophihabitans sp.]|nr:N-acetylmuramic acid 6-phosphate etherase [Jatrophihabitans sp.]